jgi:predicted dehydrogenase
MTTTTVAATPLGVAMIGYRFMGAAHSQAWRVAPHFFDLPRGIRMRLLVGRDQVAVNAAADRLGWEQTATDWREAVTRPDIDVVDIGAPSDVHADIAVAALEAGKHVLCEKPLANTVDHAERMVAAAEQASSRGIQSMVGFTYRRVPAVQLARDLVAAGEIGEVRQVRAVYLQDWLADPQAPMSWRLDRAVAGSGALGDLGSHIVDAVQFITGQQVTDVVGTTRTFVTQRPWPASGTAGEIASGSLGQVTVDDAAAFIGTLSGGALATFEATRMAPGRKNGMRLEVSGTTGSLAFDLEDLNSLQYYRTDDGPTAGFRHILVTEPEHPYLSAWWPPGHSLGYEHGFTHQVVDLVRAIASGRPVAPSFADGLQVQRVLAAVERSNASHSWEPAM